MKIAQRARRRLLVVAGLLALFTVTGFFILPPIVKAQLQQRLSNELGRTVTVEKVRVNPYTLSVTLENFAVREQDGSTLFVGWKRLYVNFDALSSVWGEWVLGEIALDGFQANVAVRADSSLNFSDLLKKFAAAPAVPAPAPTKPARPIRIGKLTVTEARVEFTDASRATPFATALGPVTFGMTQFRTVSEKGAPYHFSAVTEAGEKLGWTGTLQAEPLRSAGELKLENIDLAKYSPYYADRLQADLAAGRLSVVGRYEASLTGDQRVMRLTDGAVRLRGLKVVERATKKPAVELAAFDLTGLEVDALAEKVTARSLVFTGGHLQVRREQDGTINLLTMLQPPAAAAAAVPGPAAPVAKAPAVTVGEVALKDFQVDLTDLAAPRPVQIGLIGIQLSLKDVTLADGAHMPLQLALDWAPHGTVQVAGTVTLKPVPGADLKVTVGALELLPLSPYLEQLVNARLTQGTVSAELALQAALPAGSAPNATVAGELKLGKFGLLDALWNDELAGFGELALNGLKAQVGEKISLNLDEISLSAPYARIIIDSNKTLNLVSILKIPPTFPALESAPAAAPAATPPAAPPPEITIGRVVISDGNFRFNDFSVVPGVQMAITQFGGTIAGLTSANPTKADVDLKATVDGTGPITITGQLDPLGASKFVDLKVDFKNVDLLPLSPYSGKFAGYELARGKLALDVKVLVDGKKLDAKNVITLNQFTFGAPVKSPDATGLPVRLGVALLKDLDGKIVIDVPIEGSLDDPNLRIGKVVVRVIVNLLTKAAVSPFALLGSMFGGGGDELAFQEFVPGFAVLQPAQIGKLQTMVKALNNRPGLSLDLEGSYDAAADRYALKRVKLADEVRRAIWEAKHATDPNIAPPEQLAISADENTAMTKKLYDAKFPPGTEFGTPLPPPPAVVQPPPAPTGFFQRMIGVITGKTAREERLAQEENARRAAEHDKQVAAAKAAGVPLEEMTGRLAEVTTVSDDNLRALAQARAQAVRDYFITNGKISPDRLFLAKAVAEAAPAGKGPRVFLNLQ